MSGMSVLGYYFLLGLLVLYGSTSAESPTGEGAGVDSSDDGDATVKCEIKNNNRDTNGMPFTQAATLLLCVGVSDTLNVNVNKLQPCVEVFLNGTHDCKIQMGGTQLNYIAGILESVTDEDCKLRRIYNIVNEWDGECDFENRQREIEMLWPSTGGIVWDQFTSPIAACLIPDSYCMYSDLQDQLQSLLENDMTCTKFTGKFESCCSANCTCMSALQDAIDATTCTLSTPDDCPEETITKTAEVTTTEATTTEATTTEATTTEATTTEATTTEATITEATTTEATTTEATTAEATTTEATTTEATITEATTTEATTAESTTAEATTTEATTTEATTTEATTAEATTSMDITEMAFCSKAMELSVVRGPCQPAYFENCKVDDPIERRNTIKYIMDNCDCLDVPEKWHFFVVNCSNVEITEQHVTATAALVNTTQVEEKYYSQILHAVQTYTGNTEDVMKYPTAAKIISRERISDLTLDGLIQYVETFTDPKNLALVRQTLAQLEKHQDKVTTLTSYFASARCSLLSGVSVKVLEEPGIVSLQLAMDMCDCSEQQVISTPAKIDALCEIIASNIYYGSSKDKFGDFKAILEDLCPWCLVYSLNMIPEWKEMVLADTALKSSVCDKVGSSTALTTEDLREWAAYCTVTSGAGGCTGLRPSLMAYQPDLPSPTDLAICKDVFCTRLCSLTLQELDTLRQTLAKDHEEDVGCLTYLGDNTQEGPAVAPSAIPGSCPQRSRILKMAQNNKRRRKKRSTSCTGSCEDVGVDISVDISPPDVLDVTQIETCASPTIITCVKENDLGEFRWDVEQARALLELIRQSGTFDSLENWSSEDLQILGFIGVGFTPEELDTLGDLSDAVYEIFGVAHGWSPQQRRALAERYLRDRNLQPQDLTAIHLAKLNHIVCGLLPDQVRAIPRREVVDSTTFLGGLRRCDIGVLMELAAHLQRHYGPVRQWVEDHFSEFGIILAGLRGEDLRSVGTDLSDHVTVPFINHIPPAEFRKLSPAQTRLFPYVVAQAVSRRGLCPWLSERHKQGNVQAACNACTSLQPGGLLLLLLAAFTASFCSSIQWCLQ